MAHTAKRSVWGVTRKLFNDIHLWLGLISGIIVFVVCLSGTLYVFNTELREFARPELYKVTPGNERLQVENIIEKVKQNSGGKVMSIKVPADLSRTYTVTVSKKKPDEEGEKKENRENGLDPSKSKNNKQDNDIGKKQQCNSRIAANESENKQAERSERKDGNGKEREKKGVSTEKGAGGSGRGPRGTPLMVDPYTGEIKGDASEKKGMVEFMGNMFSLHRWLLLDKIEEPVFSDLPNRTLGSYITGTATILFTFGVITGIIIWFPRKIRAWRQGLKIKFSGNWKRINHDVHNSLGFYACMFLFLMGVTGPQWSFEWYREGLQKSLGTYQPKDAPRPDELTSTTGSGKSLKIADYIRIADAELPYEGDYTISFPKDSASTINITKNKIGFFAPAAGDKLVLDQYSGVVLKKDIFSEKSFNERVAASIKALHVGDVYGLFTKIIYFFACLIATSLPITGTLIWINKFKKSSPKRRVITRVS